MTLWLRLIFLLEPSIRFDCFRRVPLLFFNLSSLFLLLSRAVRLRWRWRFIFVPCPWVSFFPASVSFFSVANFNPFFFFFYFLPLCVVVNSAVNNWCELLRENEWVVAREWVGCENWEILKNECVREMNSKFERWNCLNENLISVSGLQCKFIIFRNVRTVNHC